MCKHHKIFHSNQTRAYHWFDYMQSILLTPFLKHGSWPYDDPFWKARDDCTLKGKFIRPFGIMGMLNSSNGQKEEVVL